MRTVRRTITKQFQPRPPWTWREEYHAGAPRVCLSQHRDPVLLRRGEKVYQAGQWDWMLRLYQHVGVTASDVLRDGYVLYDPEVEWPLIREHADWLEYVDNRHEMVFRISKQEAITASRYLETPDGPRWAVALGAYSAHERD